MIWVDWIILAALPVVLLIAALRTRRHARSVSGFLAANRCAGRYLITVAYGMAQVGVISLVWFWQQYYDVGFTSVFWGWMEGPAMIILALSGWVVYRYRQTRAMTMAQFFELRYSKRFRVFGGLVAFLSGILNYGIFPAVAARFFIVLLGLPEYWIVGGVEVSVFVSFMVMLLGTALFFVFMGGQVAVIVTDWIQGTFANWVFLAVMAYLLWLVPWSSIELAFEAAPPGKSLTNPFDLGAEEQFNAWYWVIAVIVLFYGMLSWQGTSGYNASAITPHEAKMANILSGWRFRVLMLVTLILPVCIRAAQVDPKFAGIAEGIDAVTGAQATEALQAEVRAPAAAALMLPSGLLGLFAAALLGAFISTNDTYLHSWGSIFIQDVVLPFRRTPLSANAHLWLLRLSILGVAIFAFIFSMVYTPTQYVAMFLALTGAIFVGGAGSAIIGGLYWSRGTTAGAWTAMISGMVISCGGIAAKQLPDTVVTGDGAMFDLIRWAREGVTGQELTFWSIAISIGCYVCVSLATCRKPFNMDRMLHRGKYALSEDAAKGTNIAKRRLAVLMERLGFDSEMTTRDRWVTAITLAWPVIFTAVFATALIAHFLGWAPGSGFWATAWGWYTTLALATATIIVIWFTIGGIQNLQAMFHKLRTYQASEADDGRVIDHHNADE
ncbi:MAG: sodium:solute symporter [Planctomycetes bacterium]|nr:sodium:solute symporter [Planctomycetota bacterium]MCP4839704.1 sodium:solute symporter [Planctomycetota bacterium]